MRPANVTQTAAPTWQSSASLSGGVVDGQEKEVEEVEEQEE